MEKIELVTYSAEETKRFAAKIGSKAVEGLFFALLGPMGSGKTTFTQGFVEGVGFVDKPVPVTSPTYSLIHELPTNIPIYHIDFFRLSSAEEIEELGYKELFREDSIVIAEWAEKLNDGPENIININFSYPLDWEKAKSQRTITINYRGEKAKLFFNSLQELKSL